MSPTRTSPPAIPHLCELPTIAERPLDPRLNPNRAALIRNIEKKWVNGTVLHYYFLEHNPRWRGPENQKEVVRWAFRHWKEQDIGLRFEEVSSPEDAEIRIGFEPGGSWSYVGRDCIDVAPDPEERTTNFGWDLTTPYGHDTALHELGHVLGFPHEHQNPNAGIEWNAAKTYATFSGPPNNWNRQQIEWNILRKLSAGEVQGSKWDLDSIMHYGFPAGIIEHPERFRTEPLEPAPGLSPLDIEEVRRFYPPGTDPHLELVPFESRRFEIEPGEQLNLRMRVPVSREYTIQTFGGLDTTMVLFERRGEELRYLDGDDDSGADRNALIRPRLTVGREYVIRVRLYYTTASGTGAIMAW